MSVIVIVIPSPFPRSPRRAVVVLVVVAAALLSRAVFVIVIVVIGPVAPLPLAFASGSQ
jgi:hypothetical protein